MATNDYYKHSSGQPIALSRGSSAAIRAEFDAIQMAFDKLPSVVDLNSKTGATSSQSGSAVTGIMTGTPDAIVGSFTPAIFSLISGMKLRGRVTATNTTAVPTFQADGTPALPIVKLSNTPLVAGDIPQWPDFVYDNVLTKWVLDNPTNLDKVTAATLALQSGAASIGNAPAGNIASTTVQAALNELDTEKVSIAALALGPGAATVGNNPAGSIAATTVQAAINELDLEKQPNLGFTPLNKAGDTSTGNFTFHDITASRGDGTGVIFLNAANTRYLYFDSNQYQMPGNGLNLGGTLTAAAVTAGTMTETSDERLKENWSPLPDGLLDAFASIGKLGLFDWKEDGSPGIGVGAQSLEVVCPRFVATDEDGQKSVKYGAAALVMCYLLAQEVIALRGKK